MAREFPSGSEGGWKLFLLYLPTYTYTCTDNTWRSCCCRSCVVVVWRTHRLSSGSAGPGRKHLSLWWQGPVSHAARHYTSPVPSPPPAAESAYVHHTYIWWNTLDNLLANQTTSMVQPVIISQSWIGKMAKRYFFIHILFYIVHKGYMCIYYK